MFTTTKQSDYAIEYQLTYTLILDVNKLHNELLLYGMQRDDINRILSTVALKLGAQYMAAEEIPADYIEGALRHKMAQEIIQQLEQLDD